jgi:hypothetical protein
VKLSGWTGLSSSDGVSLDWGFSWGLDGGERGAVDIDEPFLHLLVAGDLDDVTHSSVAVALRSVEVHVVVEHVLDLVDVVGHDVQVLSDSRDGDHLDWIAVAVWEMLRRIRSFVVHCMSECFEASVVFARAAAQLKPFLRAVDVTCQT